MTWSVQERHKTDIEAVAKGKVYVGKAHVCNTAGSLAFTTHLSAVCMSQEGPEDAIACCHHTSSMMSRPLPKHQETSSYVVAKHIVKLLALHLRMLGLRIGRQRECKFK